MTTPLNPARLRTTRNTAFCWVLTTWAVRTNSAVRPNLVRERAPPLRALPRVAEVRLGPNERQRMLCDHQFLVGGDDPDRHAAVRGGNARPAGSVCLLVQLHAEPCQLGAQRRTHRDGMLADAGGV